MTLRRASADDLSYILDLEQKFRGMRLLSGNDRATHERQFSNPDCLYWIVETDAAPAGFVILRDIHSRDRNIELQRIAVAEPGRGLGSQVLKVVMEKVFREFGAHRLWLDTYSDNARAQHVYRSAGFKQEGVLRECKKWGDEYRSLMLMSILESEYNVTRPALH